MQATVTGKKESHQNGAAAKNARF